MCWLKQLIKDIKLADPQRMVTVDVLVSPTLKETTAMLHEQVPEIDSFGLVLSENPSGIDEIKNLKVPYFFSIVNAKSYLNLTYNNTGAFIDSWQDMQTSETVTFNGLKDVWGRNRPLLYQISNYWHGNIESNKLPLIKILRPALATEKGSYLPYRALIYFNNNWTLAEHRQTGLDFEWYLVKTDKWGNAKSMEMLGKGADITVNIPADVSLYRLYLVGSKGKNITTVRSILNTPL
jgi:cellulose synthase (UDP-forming)